MPATKTTARYLNDTLFVSNLAAFLLSFKDNGISDPKFTVTKIFLIIFFVVFRIKVYCDDNKSLAEKEEEVNKCASKANMWRYQWTVVVAIVCWLLYTISGYLLMKNEVFAFSFMIACFVILCIWIPINGLGEPYHLQYFLLNLLYIVALGGLCLIHCENARLCLALILVLLLLIDIFVNKTLSKLYV